MRSAVVLVALGACGDVGDPPAPPEKLVTITKSPGGGLTVSVADGFMQYSMRFSDNAVHMPDQLSIRSEQVLGVDTTDPCNRESLIGVAVFPALVGAANTQAENPSSEVDILLEHPAIATILVNYTLDYQCPGPQVLTGNSTFTFFPSGRIVRQDTGVVSSTTALVVPAGTQDCGCLSGATPQTNSDHFFFTSYWAFAATSPPAVDGAGNPTTGGQQGACTITPTHSVAVNWSSNTTRIAPNSQAAHVFDFASDQTTLAPTGGDVFSALQINPTEDQDPTICGAMLQQLEPVDLTIGGVGISTDNDGIYRDSSVHDTEFDLEAKNGAIPAGFAISVNLGGSQHARITPALARPPVIAGEREDGDRFTIYFHDALLPGQRITIEPL